MLLLHPHVCVNASLLQQFLVPLMEKEVTQWTVESLAFRVLHTYRPRSAILPSLMTRIWSAPMMVDSLLDMDTQLITVSIADAFKKGNNTIQCKYNLPVSDDNCCPIGTHFS